MHDRLLSTVQRHVVLSQRTRRLCGFPVLSATHGQREPGGKRDAAPFWTKGLHLGGTERGGAEAKSDDKGIFFQCNSCTGFAEHGVFLCAVLLLPKPGAS